MNAETMNRISGDEAIKFLENFYTENQEAICALEIKSFKEFIKVIFMILDPRAEYVEERYPDDLENNLQEIGVCFIESDIKADLREDDWYKTVFSVSGKFFKSFWSVYETNPWPKMEIRHDIIKEHIKEVFPVTKTIITYE